jgi:hypothetical protein
MARFFNESNEYMTMPDSSIHSLPDSDWTFSFWIYHPDLTGSYFQYFYSHGTVLTANNLNIFTHEASEANPRTVEANIGTGLTYIFIRTGSISDDTWHHILVSRESNTAYVRQDYDAYTNSYALTSGCNPSGSVNIGRRQDGNSDRYFGGGIARPARWNRALSSDERKALANGADPLHFQNDLLWYMPFRRNSIEIVSGITVTEYNTPTTGSDPRMLYAS